MAMNYPKIGQTVEIHSYKHNSNIHRIWQETTILDVSNGVVIGANHKTLVMESDGRTWYTREPAVCYFLVSIGLMFYACCVKMGFTFIAI